MSKLIFLDSWFFPGQIFYFIIIAGGVVALAFSILILLICPYLTGAISGILHTGSQLLINAEGQ